MLLGLFIWTPVSQASDKFLRVRGELLDENTKEPISDYTIRLVEDDMDSTNYEFSKSTFDIWVKPNRETKLYFIKDGYEIAHMHIDASFIPSIAYKKKQRIEDLQVLLDKGSTRMKKPIYVAEYVARTNEFEVKNMRVEKRKVVSESYSPPFPSPAETFYNVKPTNNRLSLTKTIDKNKAKGNEGISKVIQGIIFADMSYCLFNERTNEANDYLQYLHEADPDTWGNIKKFDSPEYGRIISKTLNREQSHEDTLFALGAFLETSRLIFQDFTSDSKVLVHLKTFKNVMKAYSPGSNAAVGSFIDQLNTLVPHIEDLESDYRQNLKDKKNFEMKDDEPFKAIEAKVQEIYSGLVS